jgi:hypothetical protein
MCKLPSSGIFIDNMRSIYDMYIKNRKKWHLLTWEGLPHRAVLIDKKNQCSNSFSGAFVTKANS